MEQRYPPSAGDGSGTGRYHRDGRPHHQNQHEPYGYDNGYGYGAALDLPPGAAAAPSSSANNERGRSSESYISDDTMHSHTGLLAFRQPVNTGRSAALTPEYGDDEDGQQYASYPQDNRHQGQGGDHAVPPPLESPELYVYKEQFMPSDEQRTRTNNRPPNTRDGHTHIHPSANATSGNGHTLEKSSGTLNYGSSSNNGKGGGYTSAAGENVSSFLKGYATAHQLVFLVIVLCQTVATAVMIALTWAKIQAGTPETFSQLSTSDERSLRRRSITVYLAIFLFGSVFEIITALDALRLNNTIQLIGVVLFVVAMMVSPSVEVHLLPTVAF